MHRKLEKVLSRLDLNLLAPPSSKEEWNYFLNKVNQIIEELHEKYILSENTLAISSGEMEKLYKELKEKSQQLRKQHEQSLIQAERLATDREAKLSSLFEAMAEGMYMIGLDGRVTMCNASALKILGYSYNEIIGSHIHELIHYSHADGRPYPVEECPLYDSFINRKSNNGSDEYFWRKDGTCFPIRYSSVPVLLKGNIQGALVTFFDLTQHKEMQRTIEVQRLKVIASAKMSSLGEMAGGIAHEINNPLNIIQGKSLQLSRKIEQGSVDVGTIKAELGKIVETTIRIAKIVTGLRSFSRNSQNDPMTPAKIAQIVEDTVSLCKTRFLDRSIELRIKCDCEAELECRPYQICQVLMNLLSNAFDAVERLDTKWVSLSVAIKEDRVLFNVMDSGSGIPESTVQKMMNPFFTTKEAGKGTGLGLSISKGIVEEHHGTLVYDRTAGNTCFVVTIPLRQPDKRGTA